MIDTSTLAACESRVGTALRGKWTLERLLGIGGMAAVYVGLHKIGRRDAIKILHRHIAVSKELAARFEQEAHAVNTFAHPGVVEIRDIDISEDGCPFLVMELLEGEDLGKRAQRLGGLPNDELLRYVDELLDVLAAAHARGIVHRDIKLDNLFLTKEGHLKVLDFGIARMRTGPAVTMAGARLGTTSYMAPEQVRGEQVDGRADIFAVGATMFRVLAKRRLHDASSETELLVKMGRDPAPKIATVVPGIDPDLALVVDRALEFKPTDRYPLAATMQSDVRALRARKPPPFATARLSERKPISVPTVPDPRAVHPSHPPSATPIPMPSGRPSPAILSGPPTIANPNTTLPSEGITNVVASAKAGVPVQSAPPMALHEARAHSIGTMPSQAIAAAVQAARPSTTTPQGTTPAGTPTPILTHGHPVGQVQLGPARAAAAAAALHAPQAIHATAPMHPATATPVGPRVPPPPQKGSSAQSSKKLVFIVGAASILLGSVGYLVYAFATSAKGEPDKKESGTASAAPATPGPGSTSTATTPPAPAPATAKPDKAGSTAAPKPASTTNASASAKTSPSQKPPPSILDDIFR